MGQSQTDEVACRTRMLDNKQLLWLMSWLTVTIGAEAKRVCCARPNHDERHTRAPASRRESNISV